MKKLKYILPNFQCFYVKNYTKKNKIYFCKNYK